MNGTSILIAVTLMVILLAWYALLEYDERQQRKDTDRPKNSSRSAGRVVPRHNTHDKR